MTDEIERLEIAVAACTEHAESLRQRISRLEASMAEAAEGAPGRASANNGAGDRLAEAADGYGKPALASQSAPTGRRPLAAVRVPIQLRRPRDVDRIVNAMLYAASAVLVGTLLSLASW